MTTQAFRGPRYVIGPVYDGDTDTWQYVASCDQCDVVVEQSGSAVTVTFDMASVCTWQVAASTLEAALRRLTRLVQNETGHAPRQYVICLSWQDCLSYNRFAPAVLLECLRQDGVLADRSALRTEG